MDRLGVLKEFEKLAGTSNLDIVAVRLYLLLLANCGHANAGAISCRTIRDALGEGYSLDRLKCACRHLGEHGLVEYLPPFLEESSTEDSRLIYKILSLAGKALN